MTQKILPKLVDITPSGLYKQQVNDIFQKIRFERAGMDYSCAQLGGIFGQTAVLDTSVTLELTKFEVD